MSQYLKNIKIKGLFDEKNINWNFNDVSVLVGNNGSGKSTILRSIYELLVMGNNNTDDDYDDQHKRNLSKECYISLVDNSEIEYKRNKIDLSQEEIKKLIIKLNNDKKVKKTKRDNVQEEQDSNSETVSEVFLSTYSRDTESILKNIAVEMISTVNMSANAINKQNKSSGNSTTLLDIEIKVELDKLFNTCVNETPEIKENIKNFLEQMDIFYSESGKTVSIKNKQLEVSKKSTGDLIKIKDLSSGERQLLFILIKTLNNSQQEKILIMDEPEISLHMSWQKKLITAIKSINSKCQLIIATHSPSILKEGWLDSFVDIEDIEKRMS